MSQWRELFRQIVSTDVCCGCAACVLVCPHHVLGYDFGMEKPYQTDELRPDDCSHGQTGCDICARSCPRLDTDEGIWRWRHAAVEQHLFGRTRAPDEVYGVARQVVLARSSDPEVVQRAQDGGVASAILIHGLQTGQLQGGVVSGYDGATQMTVPKLVTTREEVLGTARSRYTYCATPLALREAHERKLRKVAMVGVSCETSAAPMMAVSGVRKWSNKIALTVGLMCSETFVPQPFLEQTLQGQYGIEMTRVEKINIKGRVVVTMDDGSQTEIPLADCRPMARTWGCPTCPDFSAEHADISLGGLGLDGWSICIVRTERGEAYWSSMLDAGAIETRPAEEEPAVLQLLERLAKRQRRRPRNVERFIAAGRDAPITVIDSEALHKRGSPEAAFKAAGAADAAHLARIAPAGASPLGEPGAVPPGEPG
ncbi:MAG TPA: Coenzyme F420 hydrogenase/dehydrogenase, beta subunit C-terminal domain [Actinomycetota bacterium]|jgi:coenzyme F420 hydrogenase subunit beta|nr:Coenzyme F420 hydrogenase/dehydrogenase, beta subunit C-terminal domain [Actinomycetota bacterium]